MADRDAKRAGPSTEPSPATSADAEVGSRPRASGMILAAGLGTRLRPLTLELPKPLVPLGDRPMVAHVAARLAAAGVGPLAMNTHHLAAAFDRPEIRALGLNVVHEAAILGTAGGVANARELLGDGDVVVWNGDTVADLDVVGLLDAHRTGSAGVNGGRGAVATLAVAPRARGEGTVGLDARGDVVRLRGERFGEELSGGDFLGVHVLGCEVRATLPREGCLVGDVYLPALRKGARLSSFLHAGAWDDVGTLAAYLAANLRWLGSRQSFVGEGAVVASGTILVRTVVGEGARGVGDGELRCVVIWPNATVTAPLADAIVTPNAVVPASFSGALG